MSSLGLKSWLNRVTVFLLVFFLFYFSIVRKVHLLLPFKSMGVSGPFLCAFLYFLSWTLLLNDGSTNALY